MRGRRLADAHAQLVRRVSRAAGGVSRAVAGVWGELLAVLRTTGGYQADYTRALAVLRRVGPVTAEAMQVRLAGLYRRGYHGAQEVLHGTLRGHSRGLAGGLPRGLGAEQSFETGDRGPLTALAVTGRQGAKHAVLATAGMADSMARRRHSLRQSALAEGHAARLGVVELIEDAHDDLAGLLLPPPSFDDVYAWLSQFVRPSDFTLIGTDTDKRMPEQLAHRIAGDMSAGKTQYEVARAIRPFLDGSRVRAARAARTFGLHVAGTAQRDAWRGLGDMLIGYEVLHTRVPDSRPWHTAREGRKYYFNPEPGQDGMEKCPHPPLEPEDPSERPPGTPHIAWNCLCALVPILRE